MPRLLYLHGLASGPASKKGLAVQTRLALHNLEVERLDLRVPSLERLSFAQMCEVTRTAIGDAPALLLGSSMGGLVAARTAEHNPHVKALVLMAPALHFAERWREKIGQEGWDRWMETGWYETPDYASKGMPRIHSLFGQELERLDVALPHINVPTLLLHGLRDEVVPIEGSRELAHQNPHIRLVEVDDGHDLLATLPQLLDEIEKFILAHAR